VIAVGGIDVVVVAGDVVLDEGAIVSILLAVRDVVGITDDVDALVERGRSGGDGVRIVDPLYSSTIRRRA
jgi:hypothetical protein